MSKPPLKPIESKEAEQTVLGGLLIDSKNISEILEKIRPEDFYYSNHQLIFQAMADLDEEIKPVDYNSVRLKLKETSNLEKIGGVQFLLDLGEQAGAGLVANLPYFVDVIHQKSTLRRLADITAKTYRECHNGHKPDELLIKIQEKIAELAAGAGVKRGSKIGSQIREWIKLSPGQFEVRQLYNDLGIVAPNEKKAVLMTLNRLEKEGLIEKIPNRRGWYRIVEVQADKIDFLNASSANWLNIALPLDIHKYVRLFPSNIVIIAGEKGSGKTAFCLDTARLNMPNFPIRYLSSEMAKEELRCRLEKFNMPIEDWLAVDFRGRRDNFADLIDPDAINIIDFLEKYDQFWTIASDIRAIFDKLQKGICIIAIQKDKGTESGRGGMFTREKCRLHIALSKKNEAKIDDVKVFAIEGYNPNGLVMKYKLIQGARFELQETGVGSHGSENW